MGVLATQSRAGAFREVLGQRAILGDGAMGTMLLSKRALAHRCLDELNLSLPALVRDVHQDYLRAGAEVVRTNTFGANRKRLEAFGFGDKVRHINQAGVRIAREAAREQAFVAGCVGPLGSALEPLGRITPEEARALFRQQVDALLEAGVDLLMLETFRDLAELREAVLAARESAGPELIIVAHVSVDDDGLLADGASPRDYGRALEELPADLVGVNCSSGPAAVFKAMERMAGFTRKPLSATPSAGVGDGCSPAYMARYTQRFLRLGARLVGGCCGTTTEHVRAMRAEVRDFVPVDPERGSVAPEEDSPAALDPVPLARRSELGSKLAKGGFVTIRAIHARRSPDSSEEVAEARNVKNDGADAVVVRTTPGAKDAAALCQTIQQQASLEAILDLDGRAGARAIQSSLLGAHALGVRNVVLHSAAAVHIAQNLNRGLDLGGHALGSQTSFAVGARLHAELTLEIAAGVGADFAISGPVFEAEAVDGPRGSLPVMAQIRKLNGARDAEFLLNEQHVGIPAGIMARINAAETPEAARAEGAVIARELIEALRSRAAGIEIVESGE